MLCARCGQQKHYFFVFLSIDVYQAIAERVKTRTAEQAHKRAAYLYEKVNVSALLLLLCISLFPSSIDVCYSRRGVVVKAEPQARMAQKEFRPIPMWSN